MNKNVNIKHTHWKAITLQQDKAIYMRTSQRFSSGDSYMISLSPKPWFFFFYLKESEVISYIAFEN